MKKFFLIMLITLMSFSFYPRITAAEEIRPITFPVDGASNFTDDFGDPRSGGRVHEGIDMHAAKMTPILSAADGYISSLPQEEPSYGYAIFIRGDDGYRYRYIHVNNDTPGTDDGKGGPLYAYAPGITRNARVVAGQHIGWVGDSGNAENVGAHLHFEIRLADDTPINPYLSLIAARAKGSFDPAVATASALTINDDRGVLPQSGGVCQSNTLMKASTTAVYYCGADGKRYVFPNQRIYLSWYSDFANVVRISDAQLASTPIGGNVTYRPGVRMVKLTTDPKVYAVDRGGVLKHVITPTIAESMYGVHWGQQVDDLPDELFANYVVGEPITAALSR